MREPWKLSPSDFAFLWEACRRCFYLKVVRGFARPPTPMPRIFTRIDAAMKANYVGRRTETIAPGLAPGVVSHGEKWVHSAPISVPGRAASCFVRGKFDAAVSFDDGTYGIVDFKTSKVKPTQARVYGRQLHAYALALEDPAPGKFALRPVPVLGLLVFEPGSYLDGGGGASLSGDVSWIPVARDDDGFRSFLDEVLAVLELPAPPPPAAACAWCDYRSASRRTGL